MESKTRLRRGILMAALTAFLWGALPIALKVSLRYADLLTIIWLRFTVAAVLLTLWMSLRRPSSVTALITPPGPPWQTWLVGAGIALNYYGYMKGIALTSPGNAQVLIQLAPMSLVGVGVIIFREPLARHQTVGFGIAATGLLLFYYDRVGRLLSPSSALTLGNVWIVIAAGAWVIYASFLKVVVRNWQPQQINILVYSFASLAFLPLADLPSLLDLSSTGWALLVTLGVNTLVAYGALAEALHDAPASMVSMILTVNPVLTFAFMILLTELQVSWLEPFHFSPFEILGALTVVGGAMCVVARPGHKQAT